MKKISLVIFALLFFLSGCSHGTEIKQRGIVEGIFIDRLYDGSYNVVVEILDSSVDSTRVRKFESESGDNINDILLSIDENTERELFYKNTFVVVIDFDFDESEVLSIITALTQNSDFEKSTKVVFCEFSDDYLDKTIKESTMISSEINSLIENLSAEGVANKGTLIDIEIDKYNSGYFTASNITLENGAEFNGISFMTDSETVYLKREECLYFGVISGEIDDFEIVLNDSLFEVFNVGINRVVNKKSSEIEIVYEVSGFARAEDENDDINEDLSFKTNEVLDKLYGADVDFLNIESSYKFYDIDYNGEGPVFISKITVNEIKR